MTRHFSTPSSDRDGADRMTHTSDATLTDAPNSADRSISDSDSKPSAASDERVESVLTGDDTPTAEDFPDGDPEIVNDPDDELLTALLDDELGSEEKKRAEERLAAEPSLQARLERLRAAGRFLDSLETVPFNRQMTETTMEMLTAVVKREIQAAEKRRHCYHFLFLILVLLILGFLFTVSNRGMQRIFQGDSVRESDIPVYTRLDALEAVGDFDFLTQLLEIPDFVDSPAWGTDNAPRENRPSENPPASNHSGQEKSPTDVSERGPNAPIPSAISSNRVDSTETYLRRMRFRSLPMEDREKYRAFYRQIEASPEKETLFCLLDRFERWFWLEIKETDRYRFWEEPDEKRIDFVRALIKERKNASANNPPDIHVFGGPFSRVDPFSPNGEHPFRRPSPDRRGGGFDGGSGKGSGHGPGFDDGPEGERFRGRFGGMKNGPIDLKKAIPQELRDEKLHEVGNEFFAFIKRHQSEPDFIGKRKQEILSEFIRQKGIGFFTAQMTENGRHYLESLPEEQKIRELGLLIHVNLCDSLGPFRYSEKNPAWERGRKKEKDSDLRQPSEKDDSSPKRSPSSHSSLGNDPIGFFWKTESTRDLAETLRNLPPETRDALLNLPDEEMYSQLLILHWGFNPKLGPFKRQPGRFPQGIPAGGRISPRSDREGPPPIPGFEPPLPTEDFPVANPDLTPRNPGNFPAQEASKETKKTEAVKPEAEPSSPAADPESEPSSPAVEPEAEPSSPAVEPEAEPSSPAVEPNTEPSSPAVEPESEPSSPAVEPNTEPSSPATEPETEPSSPATEPETEPSSPAVEPESEPSSLPDSA